ncbi:MAG: NAD-dependent deacylase [Lawsonella sp.]
MSDQDNLLDQAKDLAARAERVAVLSGAGISAESGLPTFRTSQSGLWEQFDPETLATPQAWEKDHQMVWAWYLWRNSLVRDVAPNEAHKALGDWEKYAHVAVTTQNVDDLHERGGSTAVQHVHGTLFNFICSRCRKQYPEQVELPTEEVLRAEPPACPYCGSPIRPDIVWFGEQLPKEPWNNGVIAAQTCDIYLVVGTSAVVQPAATLPRIAQQSGAKVIEINPKRTPESSLCDVSLRMSATEALPILLEARAATRL